MSDNWLAALQEDLKAQGLVVVKSSELEALIKQAADEATQEALKVASCDDCYAKGYADCREQAAKIADTFWNWGAGEGLVHPKIANEIRAMRPKDGPKEG